MFNFVSPDGEVFKPDPPKTELDVLKDRVVELIVQKQGLAGELAACHHSRLELEKKYRKLTKTMVRTALLLVLAALATLSMYIWVYRGC